jgi:hypothetical protein
VIRKKKHGIPRDEKEINRQDFDLGEAVGKALDFKIGY